MSLGVQRLEGESWRACVERVAGAEGLAEECLALFDRSMELGRNELDAAWEALYEWDCLAFLPDDPGALEGG